MRISHAHGRTATRIHERAVGGTLGARVNQAKKQQAERSLTRHADRFKKERRSHAAKKRTTAPQRGRESPASERDVRGQSRKRHSARLLTNGKQSALTKLDLIASAKSEVNTSTFIFADDRAGISKIAALTHAAATGKKVRLLIDSLGNRLTPPLMKALLESGVEVALYNPPRLRHFLMPSRLSYRMHDKLLIVDDKHLITGGRNIEDGYYGMRRPGVFEFSDTDVFVSGPGARDANQYFKDLWHSRNVVRLKAQEIDAEPKDVAAAHRRITEARDKFASVDTQSRIGRMQDRIARRSVHVQNARFVHEGTSNLEKEAPRTRNTFIELLDSAKHEVEFQTPYLLPDRKLLAAVNRATSRGVKVRFITNSPENADQRFVHLTYRMLLPAMTAAGAEVWEYRGVGVLHAKTAVADQSRVFIGSANMDPRSHKINREAGIIAKSRSLAKDVLASGKMRRNQADLVAADKIMPSISGSRVRTALSWLGYRVAAPVLVALGVYDQL